MIPVFYSAIIVLITVNVVLGLPFLTNFALDLMSPPVEAKTVVLGNQESKPAVLPQITTAPIFQSKGAPPPVLTATSVIVMDPDTNFVYFVKDPNKRVPIASTTKLMTALVALEYYDPQTILTADKEASISGSTMGLRLGERLTFRSLLFGMMLNSGNDAAFTISDNYPGGRTAFIMAMNEKAASMGLKNTHFDNPAGFDSPSHYSSASDLSVITQVAIKNYQLSKVVATQQTTVSSADQTVVHSLKNLNILLGKNGVIGVKTGYTPQAKENLIGLAQRGDRKVLTIVLGSDDRFGETQNLMEWAYQNFSISN